VLYFAAAIGAFGGIVLLNQLFGSGEGMPRFETIEARGTEYLWAIVALLAAWVLLLIFHGAKGLASRASDLLMGHSLGTFLRPVACGIVLGAVALPLPLVLFPGEEQCTELIETWQGLSWGYLLATGVLKAILTPMCIRMGWKGGDLFPCIFAGVSVGFGLAALTGADPMLMVTVTTTAFLAGVTGKPMLVLGILAICFPLRGILWIGLAALVGTSLPVWHPFAKREA
jgi:H+/Cl- antiporter ClcA